MIKSSYSRKIRTVHWKKKDTFAIFLIVFIGLVFTYVGYSFSQFYIIFFSLSLGLFIGGITLSVISTFLAQMESNITGTGELDAEIDVDVDVDTDIDIDSDVDVDTDIDIEADVDIDTDIDIEADVDIDTDIDIDSDVDVDTDIDIEAEVDVAATGVEMELEIEAGADVESDFEIETEAEIESDFVSTITPAPIMLLLSTAFLIFGISGIILFQLIDELFRPIILFIAPTLAYLTTKIINFIWKKIAKSRFYQISTTQNLIGKKGEVILPVDNRGGIIKIHSSTPMKFEKLHVKPVFEDLLFDRGEKVYICDVKNGYLLVHNTRMVNKNRRL